MDIVFIEQLSVITTIGVYDWEQTIEQKLGVRYRNGVG
ncbi:bifunctional dihydroneopterin aldolase/dihydroneopterin triphosphate 2'-epimerase [Escherichia coli]|nr:bifunctional dihydroneopterin aldolase/dihydroneopterin triphosphate 2'-epimerase [Escherichia coli]